MPTIKIDDEIGYWGISSRDVKEQLSELTGDITVEINSPGGSVIEGIAIFNALKEYNKGKVTTVNVGMAASMASYIALAGDEIKAYDNAIYMIHNASGGVWGDYRDMNARATVLKSMSNILARAYVAQTGKTDADIQEAMDIETYYFGQEILDNGFVNEIITTGAEIDEANARTLAKENFTACAKNIEKNTNAEEYEQVAAVLKKQSGVNPASAQIENKPKGETSMEYTKERFEALESDHAEALKDNTAAERKRVSDIFALGGNVEFTQKAISEGLSVGDAAIALLKAQKEAAATQATNFEAAGAEANEAGNVEAGQEELSAEDQATKDAKAALEKLDFKGAN